MSALRWQELLKRITAHREDAGCTFTQAICYEAVKVIHVDDASVTMTVGNAFTVVSASSVRAVALEDEQFTIGEGPTFDSTQSNLPILTPRLGSGFHVKWPIFSRFAISHQINASFCFPVRIGDARIGALTLYREANIGLTSQEYADALIYASLSSDDLIRSVTEGISGGASPLAIAGLSNTSEVQQAAGMLAEKFNCSVVDGLVRLRAAAYARQEPISIIAKRILNRELNLDE